MKYFLLLSCVFLVPINGYAQNKQEDSSVSFVKKQLIQPYVLTGFTMKRLVTMGDRVSIALIKIFEEHEIQDSAKVEFYLILIKSGFNAPHLIEIEDDKKPKATNLFLRYLSDKTKDTKLKAEITLTIEYVQAQTAIKK